jgi:catechol O-methyltransferase
LTMDARSSFYTLSMDKNIEKIRGSPENVLAAIDEYGRTKKYLMNVGEDKGRIVTDLIAEVKPKTMV